MTKHRKIENYFNAPKSKTKFSSGNKSPGILDDYAVRRNIDTKEGTIQHTPTAAKHILNKEFMDAGGGGDIWVEKIGDTMTGDLTIEKPLNVKARVILKSGTRETKLENVGLDGGLTIREGDDTVTFDIDTFNNLVDFRSKKGINFLDPTSDQDASTKKYVDDNLHSTVTLAGTPNYITISGQEITRGIINIFDDTNLTALSPMILGGDTANEITFQFNVANTWTAEQTFDGGIEMSDKRLIHHDYLSVTTTVDSNASAVEFDVFDEDNYSAFASTANVTAKGITFTPKDGRFTVANAGIFQITINFCLNNVVTSQNEVIIELNDVEIYNHRVGIHPSVDPAIVSITIIKSMTANQYLNFRVENVTGSNTTTAQDGTSITIIRIS